MDALSWAEEIEVGEDQDFSKRYFISGEKAFLFLLRRNIAFDNLSDSEDFWGWMISFLFSYFFSFIQKF